MGLTKNLKQAVLSNLIVNRGGFESGGLEEVIVALGVGHALLVGLVRLADLAELLLRRIQQDVVQVFAEGLHARSALKREGKAEKLQASVTKHVIPKLER